MPIPRIKESEVMQLMQKLATVYGYPNTPGSEGMVSEELVSIWYNVFKDKSFNQVKNAVDAHIEADDSLRGVFPLPGRIKKFIKPEDVFTEEEHIKFQETGRRKAKEREQRWERERLSRMTEEERNEEIRRKEEFKNSEAYKKMRKIIERGYKE